MPNLNFPYAHREIGCLVHQTKLYFTDNFKFYDKDNQKTNIIDIIIHHEKLHYIRKKIESMKKIKP